MKTYRQFAEGILGFRVPAYVPPETFPHWQGKEWMVIFRGVQVDAKEEAALYRAQGPVKLIQRNGDWIVLIPFPTR